MASIASITLAINDDISHKQGGPAMPDIPVTLTTRGRCHFFSGLFLLWACSNWHSPGLLEMPLHVDKENNSELPPWLQFPNKFSEQNSALTQGTPQGWSSLEEEI